VSGRGTSCAGSRRPMTCTFLRSRGRADVRDAYVDLVGRGRRRALCAGLQRSPVALVSSRGPAEGGADHRRGLDEGGHLRAGRGADQRPRRRRLSEEVPGQPVSQPDDPGAGSFGHGQGHAAGDGVGLDRAHSARTRTNRTSPSPRVTGNGHHPGPQLRLPRGHRPPHAVEHREDAAEHMAFTVACPTCITCS